MTTSQSKITVNDPSMTTTSENTGALLSAGGNQVAENIDKKLRMKHLKAFVRSKSELPKDRPPQEPEYIDELCNFTAYLIDSFGISGDAFLTPGGRQHRSTYEVAHCRGILCVYASTLLGVTQVNIRDFIGYNTHATVSYLLSKYKSDPAVMREIRRYLRLMQS